MRFWESAYSARSSVALAAGSSFITDRLIIFTVWIGACWPWLIGRSFTNGDNVAAFYPQSTFVVSSILRGDAPWWNPYLFGGQPALGDPQSLIFTPHTIVGLVLGRSFGLQAFDITTLACLLAGGLAMLRYGRGETDSLTGPLLGAVVFMLGGVATSRLQHVPEIISYSLLPIQLLAIRAICICPSLRTGAMLSLCCLAALLNPNQVVFLSAFGLLPFFALHVWRAAKPSRAVSFSLAAGIAALLIASPALAAMFEFLHISNRPVLPLAASEAFSLPFFTLPGMMLPGLFGMLNAKHGFWSPTTADEDYLYIGLVPACLFICSVVRFSKLTKPAQLGVAAAIFWFVFMLGVHTPVYKALFNHFPGFSGFRRPADAAFLMNFSAALVVATCQRNTLPTIAEAAARIRLWIRIKLGRDEAVGFALAGMMACIAILSAVALGNYATAHAHQKELSAVISDYELRCFILFTAVGLPWCLFPHLARGATRALLLVLTAVDLCSAGRFNHIHTLPYDLSIPARIYRHDHRDDAMQPLSDTIRFLQAHQDINDPHGSRAEFVGGPLATAMPEAARIYDAQGYNPLVLKSYAENIGAQDLTTEPKIFPDESQGYTNEAYRRVGLHFVLFDQWSMHDPGMPQAFTDRMSQLRAQLVSAGLAKARPLGIIGSYEVWEMASALPRATIIQNGTAVPTPCTIQKSRNTYVKVSCNAPGAGALVLGDNDAPGWRACVNGKPAVISIYQNLLRSVAIPAGETTIVFRYSPIPFLRFEQCRSG